MGEATAIALTPAPRTLRRLRSFSRFAGLAAAAIGVLTLAGWALDSGALTSVFPGFPLMMPLTALGHVLAGVSLFLLVRAENDAVGEVPGEEASDAGATAANLLQLRGDNQ